MAERQFVVTEDIRVGEVLAYTRGQSITEQAVTDNGWQDFVSGSGTKAAAEVQADVTGRDVSEFQTTASRGSAATATSTKQEG